MTNFCGAMQLCTYTLRVNSRWFKMSRCVCVCVCVFTDSFTPAKRPISRLSRWSQIDDPAGPLHGAGHNERWACMLFPVDGTNKTNHYPSSDDVITHQVNCVTTILAPTVTPLHIPFSRPLHLTHPLHTLLPLNPIMHFLNLLPFFSPPLLLIIIIKSNSLFVTF